MTLHRLLLTATSAAFLLASLSLRAQQRPSVPSSTERPGDTTSTAPQLPAAVAPDTSFQQRADTYRLVLNVPLFDLPYGQYAANRQQGVADVNAKPEGYSNVFKAWGNPSMEQSTQFSLDTRYAIFYGTKRLFRRQDTDHGLRKAWKMGAEIALNGVLDVELPFGPAWQHEEYHRATMTRCNIASNNTLNDWLTGRKNANFGSISGVNDVLDANLVALKKLRNPDLVRLAAAGVEGEVYGGEQLQQNSFFYHTGYLNSLNILYRFLSPVYYMSLCADKVQVTDLTRESMNKEGLDPAQHDFTGADFTAWAYDLYHPTEPYAARGPRTDGSGIDRYIYGNKLTDTQYDWLQKQSRLAWLNILSPMNFFLPSLTLKRYANGEKLEGNFAFRYYPTSFGNQLGLNLLLKKGKYNLLLNPALNQNLDHSFPSLEAQLLDYPVSTKLLLTTRVIAWTQPKGQAFETSQAEWGGLLAATVHYQAGHLWFPYASVGYKTNGWVASNAFLNRQWDAKIGVSVRL
jgi:hypothetical protein